MHSVQVRPRFAWTKGQPKTIGSLPLLLMKSRGKPAPQTSPRDVVHLRPSEARTDGWLLCQFVSCAMTRCLPRAKRLESC